MGIVQLVFLLIAVLMVIGTLFPDWNFSRGPVIAPNRLIALVIGLVVLFILYLIVLSLFGPGPVAHSAAPAQFALGGGLMLGVLDTSAAPKDPTAPKPWYTSLTVWFNVISAVVVIGSVFVDPSLGFDPRIIAIATAVITAGNAALRIIKTNSAILGTPAAAQAEVAKQDIAIHAAATGTTPPAS